MKNYVRPSLEINKFTVEDIICASGELTANFAEGSAAANVYTEYLTQNSKEAESTVVEFQW